MNIKFHYLDILYLTADRLTSLCIHIYDKLNYIFILFAVHIKSAEQ